MLNKLRSKTKLKSRAADRFLEAAHAGNHVKVLEFITKGIDINLTNEIGVTALHLSAKEGHITVVDELLKHGSRVDATTQKGITALHVASLSGKVDVIQLLLDNNAKVNSQSKDGFTPLYMAAQENHLEAVKCLLSSGASQSLTTEDGFTALSVALQQGHDNIANVLLDHGTSSKLKLPQIHIATKKNDVRAVSLLLKRNNDNVNVTSKSGFTPLHIAAHYGNSDIGRLLIEKGASVNCQAKNGICPLHVACKRGRFCMVSLLTDNAADMNCQTKDGMTPIHIASANGGSKIIENLLEKGAIISAKTRNGFSALHLATQGDHMNSAKQLLLHGANIDEISLEYLTPLHITAHYGNVRSAYLLLENKCDVNPKAMNGFSPLHVAAKRNHKEIVDLLVKFGAMIEVQTETGITPLHVASFMGHTNIVQALLRLGTNPDSMTSSGDTPLHLATRNKHLEAMDLLLHSRSQVDPRTVDHFTPLHIAIDNSDIDGATLLLHHGASPSAKMTELNTPLHFAVASAGKNELVHLLLEHGASTNSANKRGFTPLHVAAKHGNVRGMQMLLARCSTEIDKTCDNGLTPLHVAVHYNQVNSVLLLLKNGASANVRAKNECSPLHIAASENRMNVVPHLLEHSANINAETESGFTPLHFSTNAGHMTMTSLLLERGASVDHVSRDGLTPLHFAALGNRVPAAEALLQFGAKVNSENKSGLRPIHLASQCGHVQMVNFLLSRNADGAMLPKIKDSNSALAGQLNDDSAVNLIGTNFDQLDQNSESSEFHVEQDIGEEESTFLESHLSQPALNCPVEISDLFDFDAFPDPCNIKRLSQPSPCSRIRKEFAYTRREDGESTEKVSLEKKPLPSSDLSSASTSSVEPSSEQMLTRDPDDGGPPCLFDRSRHSSSSGLTSNFLIAFLVDARGGTMQGCRDSGIRVVIPPDATCQPTRITCRYVRREKLLHNPPLNDGEGLATRVLEMGPEGTNFSEPVLIEVSHYASLKDRTREVVVLRSDSGHKWCEHTAPFLDEETFQSVFGQREESIQKVQIVTKNFPRYFALVSRFRHEILAVGPEGGVMASKVDPKVQAIFPAGSIKRSTKVHLQIHPVDNDIVERICGMEISGVSPVVSIEPRHRRFHQPIAVTIPIPKSMIGETKVKNSYLKVLASRSEGAAPAVWEDITDGIALTILNGCATLLVTVSARFWLIDFSSKNFLMGKATELYRETLAVPFWTKFAVFAKRLDAMEARIRLFSIIDGLLGKTVENQEGFNEVVRSDEVEVCDGKSIHVEVSGSLVPLTNSSQDLCINFHAFRENRLPFAVKVKEEPLENVIGELSLAYRIKSEPPPGGTSSHPASICILRIKIPNGTDSVQPSFEVKLGQAVSTADAQISKAELHLTDIADVLDADWLPLAVQLGLSAAEVNEIRSDYDFPPEQALIMLHHWVLKNGEKATGNNLERALKQIGRADVIAACMHNISDVTDDDERLVAKNFMNNSDSKDEFTSTGFIGALSSRDSSIRRRASSEISYGDLSSLPGSRSFCCDTSSEVSSFAGKDEYSKSLFDHSDDRCYFVDGSINSDAYATMRSIESEESDAVLSNEEARVTADASVRLSQISDVTMTPDDGEEMERSCTPCAQEITVSNNETEVIETDFDKERDDYPRKFQNHVEKELLIEKGTTARGENFSRYLSDAIMNKNNEAEIILGKNPHKFASEVDQYISVNPDNTDIVIEVEEGDLYLNTDVREMEEILDDRTRVKRRIVTRKQVQPIEKKFVRGNVILEKRISEKVIHIEIDEDITELESGVNDEYGANLICNSTTKEFEDMLPDGTLVQKRIMKVHVGQRPYSESVSDFETAKTLEPGNDLKADISKDIQSQECLLPTLSLPVTDNATKTEKTLEVIERMEGEVVQEVEEYNDDEVSENGVKINRKITTIRHLLPVTEKIRAGKWKYKVFDKFELVGTEIDEEVTEMLTANDGNLELELKTSVDEWKEMLPDGTWLRKRITQIMMIPKQTSLSLNVELDANSLTDLKIDDSLNPELRKRPETIENKTEYLVNDYSVGSKNELSVASTQRGDSNEKSTFFNNSLIAGQFLKNDYNQTATIQDQAKPDYDQTASGQDQPRPEFDQTAGGEHQSRPENDQTVAGQGQPRSEYYQTATVQIQSRPEYDKTVARQDQPRPEFVQTADGQSQLKPECDQTAADQDLPRPENDETATGQSQPRPEYDQAAAGQDQPKLESDQTAGEQDLPRPEDVQIAAWYEQLMSEYDQTVAGQDQPRPEYDQISADQPRPESDQAADVQGQAVSKYDQVTDGQDQPVSKHDTVTEQDETVLLHDQIPNIYYNASVQCNQTEPKYDQTAGIDYQISDDYEQTAPDYDKTVVTDDQALLRENLTIELLDSKCLFNLNQETMQNREEMTDRKLSHILNRNEFQNEVDSKMLNVLNQQKEILNDVVFKAEFDSTDILNDDAACKENNENENKDKKSVREICENAHLKDEIMNQVADETKYIDDADKKCRDTGITLSTEITEQIDQTTADHFYETNDSAISPHITVSVTETVQQKMCIAETGNQSQILEKFESNSSNKDAAVNRLIEEDLQKNLWYDDLHEDKFDSMVVCSDDTTTSDVDEFVCVTEDKSHKETAEQESLFTETYKKIASLNIDLDREKSSQKPIESGDTIIAVNDDDRIVSNMLVVPEDVQISKMMELNNSEILGSSELSSEQTPFLLKVDALENSVSEHKALMEDHNSLESAISVKITETSVLEAFSNEPEMETEKYSTAPDGTASVNTANWFTENFYSGDKLTSENLTENRNEDYLLNHQHSVNTETASISERMIDSKIVELFNAGYCSQLGLLPQEPQTYQSHDDGVGHMTATTEGFYNDTLCSQGYDTEGMDSSHLPLETYTCIDRNSDSLSGTCQMPSSGFGDQNVAESNSASTKCTFDRIMSDLNSVAARSFDTEGAVSGEKSYNSIIIGLSVSNTFLQDDVTAPSVFMSELPVLVKQGEHFQESNALNENIAQGCEYYTPEYSLDENTLYTDWKQTNGVLLEGFGSKPQFNEPMIEETANSEDPTKFLLSANDYMLNEQLLEVVSEEHCLNDSNLVHELSSEPSEIMDVPISICLDHSLFKETPSNIKLSDILAKYGISSNQTISMETEEPAQRYLLREQPQEISKDCNMDSCFSRGLTADEKSTQFLEADYDNELSVSPSDATLLKTPTEFDIQLETPEFVVDDVTKHQATYPGSESRTFNLTPLQIVYNEVPDDRSCNHSDDASEESQKSKMTTPRSKRINYSRAERRLGRVSQSQEGENVLIPSPASADLELVLKFTTSGLDRSRQQNLQTSPSKETHHTQMVAMIEEDMASPVVTFQKLLKSPLSRNTESDAVTFETKFDHPAKEGVSQIHSRQQLLSPFLSSLRQSLPISILDEDDSLSGLSNRTSWDTVTSSEADFSSSDLANISTSTISSWHDNHSCPSPCDIVSPTSPGRRDISFRKRERSSRYSVSADLPAATPQTPPSDYIFQFPRNESSSLPPISQDLSVTPGGEVQENLQKSSTITSDRESLSPTDFSPIESLSGSRQPNILQSTLEAHARFLNAIAKIDEIAPGLLLSPTLMGPDVTQETIKGKIHCSTSEHDGRSIETDDRKIMKKSTIIRYFQPITRNFFRDGVLIETRNSEIILGKYIDDYIYDSPKDVSSFSDINSEMSTSVDVSEETLSDGTWLKHKTTRVVVGPAVHRDISSQHLVSSSEKNQKFHPSSMRPDTALKTTLPPQLDVLSAESINRHRQDSSKVSNIPDSPSTFQRNPPSKDLVTILSEMQKRTSIATGATSASLQAILEKLGLAKLSEKSCEDKVEPSLQESGSESVSMDSSASTDQSTISESKTTTTATDSPHNLLEITADLSSTKHKSEKTVDDFVGTVIGNETSEKTSTILDLVSVDKNVDVSITLLACGLEKSCDKSVCDVKDRDRTSDSSDKGQKVQIHNFERIHSESEKVIETIDKEMQFQKNVENLIEIKLDDDRREKETEKLSQESHSIGPEQFPLTSSTTALLAVDDGSSVDYPENDDGKAVIMTNNYQDVEETQNICPNSAEEETNEK